MRKRNAFKILVRHSCGECFGDGDVGRRIILKWALKRFVVQSIELDLTWGGLFSVTFLKLWVSLQQEICFISWV
jgi:hypothetical protein